MKADEAIRRVEFIVDKTVSDWGNVMLEVAQTADTMIKDRVIKTGQNAQGEQYDPYSTNPMLTNCSQMTQSACNKKTGSKAKN